MRVSCQISCTLFSTASTPHSSTSVLSVEVRVLPRPVSLRNPLVDIPQGLLAEKERLLYGGVGGAGLLQTALAWTFRLLADQRTKKPQCRYSVRLSAVHFSQRDAVLSDLLSPFCTERRGPVTVVDEPGVGVSIENESEVRVDSLEQALFYLNTVIDHRLVGFFLPPDSLSFRR